MKNKKIIIIIVSIILVIGIGCLIFFLNKKEDIKYTYTYLNEDYQMLTLSNPKSIAVLNNTLVKLTIKENGNVKIDEYNIDKNITDEDNVIEFTPTNEGTYKMIINNKTYFIKVESDKSLFKVYDPNACNKDAC